MTSHATKLFIVSSLSVYYYVLTCAESTDVFLTIFLFTHGTFSTFWNVKKIYDIFKTLGKSFTHTINNK